MDDRPTWHRDSSDEEPGLEEKSGGAAEVTDHDEGTGHEYDTGLDENQADKTTWAKRRSQWNPRKWNKLTTETIIVTWVHDDGTPASPKADGQGYSNDLGCILRETVKITCCDIREKEATHHSDLLLQKLFNKYDFPEDDKLRVASKALCIFMTALSSWKYHAIKKKDQDFWTVVKPMWPTMSEEDWNDIIEACSGDDFKKKS